MIEYLTSAFFIISATLASAGVLTSVSLKKKYDTRLFTSLIFFQIFYFIFGFYGIWGQLVVSKMLSPYFETLLFTRISNISLLSAYPFLILTWMMLLSICRDIANRKSKNRYYLLFLIFNFAILPFFGMLIYKFPEFNAFSLLKFFFIALTIIYYTLAGISLLLRKKEIKLFLRKSIIILSSGIFLSMLLLVISAIFVERNIYFVLVFILIYFLNGSFIPLYIRYIAEFSPIILQSSEGISFEDFCLRFEISPRESEIISEICNGLSNQEIADKLFISLQTVKGHTYRIYLKTNIRSRAQLITLVNSFQ